MQKFIPKRKREQLIVDTTCQEANITFPTDTNLLKKTWNKLVSTIEKIRDKGEQLIIRGKHKIKKNIRAFDLQRQKSRKIIQKMRKKLLRENKKLIKKIKKFITDKAMQVSN